MPNELILQIGPLSETQVVIDSVRTPEDTTKQYKVIVLYNEYQDLFLPVWIGPIEAEVIVSELNNIPHQTTTNFIDQIKLTGKPIKISITDLINQVYKATITVEESGNEIHIPMRPSDVLAVAVRLDLPIFANHAVMEKAGVSPPNSDLIVIAYSSLKSILTKIVTRLSPKKSNPI